jgi:hypothetical protein
MMDKPLSLAADSNIFSGANMSAGFIRTEPICPETVFISVSESCSNATARVAAKVQHHTISMVTIRLFLNIQFVANNILFDQFMV